VTLRVNPRRATTDAVVAELEAAGVAVERGRLVADALVVRGTGDPRALPAVRDGRATPQDQGSQAVVGVLDPQPGERVLDVAAAPGGKATAAAERVGDDGLVVAADLYPGRLRLVRDAALRLGLISIQPVVSDGARATGAVREFRPGAPRRSVQRPGCTASTGRGALARTPERRRAARVAAARPPASRGGGRHPGGRLVYAVCTLTRAETSDIDTWAAAALPELVALEPPGEPWRRQGRGAVILPCDADTDGMFVLAFERSRT